MSAPRTAFEASTQRTGGNQRFQRIFELLRRARTSAACAGSERDPRPTCALELFSLQLKIELEATRRRGGGFSTCLHADRRGLSLRPCAGRHPHRGYAKTGCAKGRRRMAGHPKNSARRCPPLRRREEIFQWRESCTTAEGDAGAALPAGRDPNAAQSWPRNKEVDVSAWARAAGVDHRSSMFSASSPSSRLKRGGDSCPVWQRRAVGLSLSRARCLHGVPQSGHGCRTAVTPIRGGRR